MKYNTLKRVKGKYELRGDSIIFISLPNGDDLILYASDDSGGGKYRCGDHVWIHASSHKSKGSVEALPRHEQDHPDYTSPVYGRTDPFSTSCESIQGCVGNKLSTKLSFTQYHTDDDYEQWLDENAPIEFIPASPEDAPLPIK